MKIAIYGWSIRPGPPCPRPCAVRAVRLKDPRPRTLWRGGWIAGAHPVPHVDAEGGRVLDEVLSVAAVHPDLSDPGVVGGDLVQEARAGDGVLDARRGDQHREVRACR